MAGPALSGVQPTRFASHLVTVCYLEGPGALGQVGVVWEKASNRLLASMSNPIRTVAAARVRNRSSPPGARMRQPVEACQYGDQRIAT